MKLDAVGARLAADAAGRAQLRAELERAVASSPRHSETALTLCSLDIADSAYREQERLFRGDAA